MTAIQTAIPKPSILLSEHFTSGLLCDLIASIAAKTESTADDHRDKRQKVLLNVNESIDNRAFGDFSTDRNAGGGPSSPGAHKRKICEAGQGTHNNQLNKAQKTNCKPRPIIKLLTVVRQMEQRRRAHAVAQAEAQARAQAAAEAEAQARVQAAAKIKAEAEAQAEAQAAVQEAARAKMAQAHFQAVHSRLQSFLILNAPKSVERQRKLKLEGRQTQHSVSVVTHVHNQSNKRNNYLEIIAVPSPQIRNSGALLFVDETKSHQEYHQQFKSGSQIMKLIQLVHLPPAEAATLVPPPAPPPPSARCMRLQSMIKTDKVLSVAPRAT